MSARDELTAQVAERIADAACDLDWMARHIANPVLREETRAVAGRAHRVAMALAREAGVAIYALEDEDMEDAA